LIGVLQRVKKASVWIKGEEISKIGKGLLLFVGITRDDTEKDIEYIVKKVINLRIFSDENNNLNLSLLDIEGELLVVSQFTLLGDTKKGRRPSFSKAMPPDEAKVFYNKLVGEFKKSKLVVKEGVFQEMMEVKLINEGPVTILVDSKEKKFN